MSWKRLAFPSTSRMNAQMVKLFVVTLIALLLSGGSLDAQASPCPPLPKSERWKAAADYTASRDSVVRVLQWLCRTPLNLKPAERSEANACVLIWLSGTSDVTVSVRTAAMPFLEDDEELIYPVIHGMALYQLQHPREKNEVVLHAQGLAVLADLAEQSESLSRARYLRALLRAHRRNQLEDFVKENLSLQSAH